MGKNSLSASVDDVLNPYYRLLPTMSDSSSDIEIPSQIRKLWTTIMDHLGASPLAQEAIADLLNDPDKDDVLGSFRWQLQKHLDRDIGFRNAVRDLISLQHQDINSVAVQYGEGNVVVQGTHNIVTVSLAALRALDDLEGAALTKQHSLREGYLLRIFELCNRLEPMSIGPSLAMGSQLDMGLTGIYTPLSSQNTDSNQSGANPTPAQSAVEWMNRRRRLVILGEPGSGKSTFLKYAALCMSGDMLSRTDVNLGHLSATPDPDTEDTPSQIPSTLSEQWIHGALIPILINLGPQSSQSVSLTTQTGTATDLLQMISRDLETAALGHFEKDLFQELHDKGGLLLLDGLDEFVGSDSQQVFLRNAIEDFGRSFPKCRIVVTSRVYAYQTPKQKLPTFSEIFLAPLEESQIHSFVNLWYSQLAIIRGWEASDTLGKAEDLKQAIAKNAHLSTLAQRPLLLSLIASLHAWRGGRLPERLEELYAQAVDLLLDQWEQPKSIRDSEGKLLKPQPSLVEWLRIDREKMRRLLSELAFKALLASSKDGQKGDLLVADLIAGLLQIGTNPDVNPARLVEFLGHRSGLLIERSPGVFSFPHLTLQEYLAACHLTNADYPHNVVRLVREDFLRWREVCLLSGAKAAQGGMYGLWALVRKLCPISEADGKTPDPEVWSAFLAARLVVTHVDIEKIDEEEKAQIDHIKKWLTHIVTTGRLPVLDRVQAADDLALLGDPRFDRDCFMLPKADLSGFLEIPLGRHTIGCDSKQDKFSDIAEQPAIQVDLAKYYISVYPVTIAQFDIFAQAVGRSPTYPDLGLRSSSYPANNVSWHEAMEYCAWLTEALRTSTRPGPISGFLQLNPSWIISLPTESQYEVAARGSHYQRYPWRKQRNSSPLANVEETGIGELCPVGCFPEGKSPQGAHDLSGNTWEWTCSLFDRYAPEHPPRRVDRVQSYHLVCIRGGSYATRLRYARSSYRGWAQPDQKSTSLGFRLTLTEIEK